MITCTLKRNGNTFNFVLTGEQHAFIRKYLLQCGTKQQLKQLVKKVCHYYDVNSKELYGKSRKAEVVSARNIVMYYAMKKLNFTTERTGKIFNRDHATAIHSFRKVEKSQMSDYIQIIYNGQKIAP